MATPDGRLMAVRFTASLKPRIERTVRVTFSVSPWRTVIAAVEDCKKKSGEEYVKLSVTRAVS